MAKRKPVEEEAEEDLESTPTTKKAKRKKERLPRINSAVRGSGVVFEPGDEDELVAYLRKQENGAETARALEDKGVISNFTSVSQE